MPPEEISITLEDMKSKKGLSRKAYSVEKTLKDLIDEIGYEGIETATSKKNLLYRILVTLLTKKDSFPTKTL